MTCEVVLHKGTQLPNFLRRTEKQNFQLVEISCVLIQKAIYTSHILHEVWRYTLEPHTAFLYTFLIVPITSKLLYRADSCTSTAVSV